MRDCVAPDAFVRGCVAKRAMEIFRGTTMLEVPKRSLASLRGADECVRPCTRQDVENR